MDPAPGSAARRRRLSAAVAAVLTAATAVPVAAHTNPGGFKTSQPAMLVPVMDGVTVEALLTVGETLPGGYRFEAIPDGISFQTRGRGRVDVYLNHETSTVPFPWAFTGNGTPKATPSRTNSQNDFDNSQLSHLTLNQHGGGILHGRMALGSSAGFQRFCSNYLATAAEGFERDLLFLNEETSDTFNQVGLAFPPSAGSDPRQGGYVVAFDPKSGAYRTVPGMGRLNHENSVAVPGFSKLALLTGDDTFSSNPPNSQLYLYLADSAADVWNDAGGLYAFGANDANVDDYYDVITPGATVAGTFHPVPRAVAIGDQTALETWGQDAAHEAFDFIRIEDIAYDRTQPGVAYLADSGRGSSNAPNGRIWKLAMSEQPDGSVDATLTLLLNFDRDPVTGVLVGTGVAGVLHQLDNLETTASHLYITEDPSTGNKFAPGTGTTARLWRLDLASGALEIVARVDQSLDEWPGGDGSPADQDFTAAANWGDWESSGIIDASAAFGPGAFLIDIQAHSYWVERADGPDFFGNPDDPNVAARTMPDGQPDWSYKREGGQLLLIRIAED